MLRQCHRKCHAPEAGLVWALLVLLAFVLFPGCGRGGGGSSAPSSPTPPPTTLPLNIAHSVELNWDASESPGVQTYRVYRCSQSGGPYTMIGSTSAETHTFSDTNVQSGNTYFYGVTAVRKDMIESSYSKEARAVIPPP